VAFAAIPPAAASIDDYFGHVDFMSSRVIEVGLASGFSGFRIERVGTNMARLNSRQEAAWDFVPRTNANFEAFAGAFENASERIRSGLGFLHALAARSADRVVAS